MATNLAVHVTPRSGRDAILGLKTDDAGKTEVHVCVTAPPDGGKATKAVVALIAKALSCPKSKVEVVRGMTSRHKLLAVPFDASVVESWLAGLKRL